jgi:hypothetical protein
MRMVGSSKRGRELTAGYAAWRRFELLDAAFQRIQALVGPLRGLIGGLGALAWQ